MDDRVSGGRAEEKEGQASSLVRALARLGCTRIGSPGIFGVQTRQTSCSGAKYLVALERIGGGYPGSAFAPLRRSRSDGTR
ncbi:MAG: hypothetical protein JWO98_2578 [Frankiales bacterium]|nr:hypothetical protein [Frankiales bacterium]